MAGSKLIFCYIVGALLSPSDTSTTYAASWLQPSRYDGRRPISHPPRLSDISSSCLFLSNRPQEHDQSLSSFEPRGDQDMSGTPSVRAIANQPGYSRRHWLGSIGSSVATFTAASALSTPSTASAAESAPALVASGATCDSTVSVWKRGNRVVYLLGTAVRRLNRVYDDPSLRRKMKKCDDSNY